MDNSTHRFTDRELLDILFQSENATAIHTSPLLIIQSANKAMLDIWAKGPDVIGLPLEVALPELHGQPFLQLMQNVWYTGITYADRDTACDLLVDGKMQTFYFDFVYRALKSDAGEVYAILHTATDVTERNINRFALEHAREQADALLREQVLNEELASTIEELNATNEELVQTQQSLQKLNNELEVRVADRTKALGESEARMRYMLADAPVAIAILNGRNLVVESVNTKMLEAWGKQKDIIGLELQDALPELQGQPFLTLLDEVYTSGVPFYGNEVNAMLAQGDTVEEKYFNFVYHPVKDTEGATISILVVANAITEQVTARKKVEQAEEMMRFAIEAANVGTWYVDGLTRKFVPSPRLKELFGYYPNEDVTYEMVSAQIPEGYRERIHDAIERSVATGGDYDMVHPITGYHDKKERWVRALGKMYPDASGKLVNFSGLVIDITEQKLDEIRKNDFIGMVSHELKTPLTSLSAYVQMLHHRAGKTEDAFAVGALEKVNKQVKKMTSMINGFLNVSRLESGKIQLNKFEFNLTALVQEMIDETALTSPSHAITLQAVEKTMITADRDKIGSVLSNLLSNAVKYSPKGKNITVTCTTDTDKVTVSVKDEGMGVKPDQLDKLFDRFYRVESRHTQHISGFGIGLYLSAEIIQHHNGKIWAESESGQGSTFYFYLPLK